MNYAIFTTPSFKDFESVTVGLLKHYPSSDPNDHLFCQFQGIVSPAGMHLKVLAFEVETGPKSSFVIELSGSGRAMRISADHTGNFEGAEGLSPKWLMGGDLQGEYWGASFLIPASLLKELTEGDKLWGNVSKYKQNIMDCSLFSQEMGIFHILQ